MARLRILGVDPGLRVTGYGIIDAEGERCELLEGGIIEPDSKRPLEERLAVLHRGMNEIVAQANPDIMVVEELWSAYKNPTTAVLMGHARGVLCLVAGSRGVPVRHLGHSLVKRALIGNGAAKKAQVAQMVAHLLRLRALPGPEDVSDALALALAFANIERHERVYSRAGLALQRS